MTKQTQNFSKSRHLQQEMLSRFCAEVATWTFIGNTWGQSYHNIWQDPTIFNKQQLHLFPLKTYRFWRSWIFTFELDFKPSITTASSENPANHLRSVQKEQAPSCQDCQKAMGRACSSAQTKTTECQRSFEHRFRWFVSWIPPTATQCTCNLPPSSVMELLTTLPHRHLVLPSRLPATSIDAADCHSMKRIYNSFLIDPNKWPQM